jgi:pyrroline-5-carboxylate reductase
LKRITQILGFIGSGRMATALARGCVQAGLVDAEQVLAVDPSEAARQQFAKQVPAARLLSNAEQLLTQAEIVVLAVKPQVMAAVVADLAPHTAERHLFVSIAAGITLTKLDAMLPAGKIVRVMPNTPCLIGLGASCYSLGRMATHTEGQLVQQILASVGMATQVEETLLDAVTGLSGSGPAFVYSVIEALAAGGAAMGLPQQLALELATRTTRGAAEMLLSTGCTPAELREQVTSPGGTTLAGLDTFAKLGCAAALQSTVEAATKRSVELGGLG